MITTDFRHPFQTGKLSPLAAILSGAGAPAADAGPQPIVPVPAAPAAAEQPEPGRAALARLLGEGRRDTGSLAAAMPAPMFDAPSQIVSPMARARSAAGQGAATSAVSQPAAAGAAAPDMARLYAGEEMRAFDMPAGADPWTGEGFGTSRGTWKHALAGNALAMAAPVPAPGFGTALAQLLAHSPDATVGRQLSAVRAAPGAGPFGGLVNARTGMSWSPEPTADLVAQAAARRVAAAPVPKVGQPVKVSAVARQAGGAKGAGAGGAVARSAEARANVRDQLGRSWAGSSGRTLAR